MTWKRKGNAITKPLLITHIFMLLIISSTSLSFGHSFSSSESAVFLALVNAIKAEAKLVQENLASNNISLASEHANKASALFTASVQGRIADSNQTLAEELDNALTTLKASTESSSHDSKISDINIVISDLDAIFDGIVNSRVDPDQLSNSTIQALTIVELLDRVLTNYGDAYEVGFDMTNMSMMMGGSSSDKMNSMSSVDMDMDMDNNDHMSTGDISATGGFELVNITSYQSAQVLAKKAQELFNSQLINSSAGTQSSDNIAAGLQELVSTIDNEGTPMDIMTIVHTRIHPNFITAFGLELSTEH